MKYCLLFLLFASCFASDVAIPGRLIIKHLEADGVGFNGGYSTVEAMMAVPTSHRHIPFADIRYHVFNRGKSALNGGVGYRYNIGGSGVLFGLNAYYDARWTTGQTFSQFGGGLELLSRFIDFRFNGYFPVKESFEIRGFDFEGFEGNNIIVDEKKRLALTGGNGEAGFYFARLGDLKMYLAGGSYYFKRQQCNTNWGARGRLRFSWLDNIWAEFAVSHDDLFKTNYQGIASIQIPFWKKPRHRTWSYFPNFEAMMVQPPVRDEIIVLCDVNVLKPARGPDGNIIDVYFVNNTSSSNGTFQSPFPTLLEAQNASGPGNVIYVYPGDGTTMGMDAGITLQDRQLFYGAGVEQEIPLQQGTLKVPPLASGTPTITNLAGSAVTVAASDVIRGINITSPTMRGILGTNPGTLILDQVSISSAGTNGIELSSTGSELANLVMTDVSVTSSGMSGVSLTASNGSTFNANVTSSTLNNNTTNGFTYLSANTADGTVTFTGNTLSGNMADGVNLTGGGEALTATVSNNTINNTSGVGARITSANTAIVTATLDNNSMNTMSTGIDIVSNPMTTISATMDGNTIASPVDNGFLFDNSLGGTATATVTNNTVSGGAGRGFRALSGASGVQTLTLNDNTVASTGNVGIQLAPSASGTINASSIQNNSVTVTGASGIIIDGSGNGAVVTATLSGNTVNATNFGLDIGGSDSRTFTITCSNNTFTSTGNANVNVTSSDTEIFNLTFTSNTCNNGALGGFVFNAEDTSTMTVNASQNTANNNTGRGIFFQGKQTGGAGNNITLTSNTFSNNTGQGIEMVSSNASVNTFVVTSNAMTSNATLIESEDTSSICTTFSGNTSNNNDYTISLTGGSTLNVVSSSGDATAVQNSNTGSGANPITFSGGVTFVSSCP